MKARQKNGAAALAVILLLTGGCAKTVHVPPPPDIAKNRVWEAPISWRFSAAVLPTAPVPPPPSALAVARAHLVQGDRQAAMKAYQTFLRESPDGPEQEYARFNLAVLQGLGHEYAAAQQSLKELNGSANPAIRAASELLRRLIEERNILEKQKQEQLELTNKLDRQVRTLKRTVGEKTRTLEERERELEERERTLQESIDKLKRLILDPPP